MGIKNINLVISWDRFSPFLNIQLIVKNQVSIKHNIHIVTILLLIKYFESIM